MSRKPGGDNPHLMSIRFYGYDRAIIAAAIRRGLAPNAGDAVREILRDWVESKPEDYRALVDEELKAITNDEAPALPATVTA